VADAVFSPRSPTLEDYWRGIILLGRNVASYKFALAKALLELRPVAGQLVKLDELALPFARHVAAHLKLGKQGTFGSSQFLDACRRFNEDGDTDRLVEQTVRLGFNNVIDAFHVIGRGDIPQRFFMDARQGDGGIRITDEFTALLEGQQAGNLPTEVESRWRLVETAWELGVSRSLLAIDYDPATEALFAVERSRRRKPVTSSRGALNGYQRGRCFYCGTTMTVAEGQDVVDVDHFFPHMLKQHGFGPIVDGIWNLVLACTICNRGPGGKFDQLPALHFLEHLHARNEFLISSHHPLRETLMRQTGATEPERRGFLNELYNRAWAVLILRWEPLDVVSP
jgi:hypothetical protein